MVRPCGARDFDELVVSGLASMYQTSDWSICFGPSWTSALGKISKRLNRYLRVLFVQAETLLRVDQGRLLI